MPEVPKEGSESLGLPSSIRAGSGRWRPPGQGMWVRYYLSLAPQPRKSRILQWTWNSEEAPAVAFSSVWARLCQAEGTESANARRNRKEVGGRDPVIQRRGGRIGRAELGRTKARQALKAVFALGHSATRAEDGLQNE